MNGKIPKYRENKPLPIGYMDPPDPYKTPEPSDINIRKLVAYAKRQGKSPIDVTYEEVLSFMH